MCIIPQQSFLVKVFQEDQWSNLIDEQHFYQETTASLSIPQQICSQYSKYQLQVYTVRKIPKQVRLPEKK